MRKNFFLKDLSVVENEFVEYFEVDFRVEEEVSLVQSFRGNILSSVRVISVSSLKD